MPPELAKLDEQFEVMIAGTTEGKSFKVAGIIPVNVSARAGGFMGLHVFLENYSSLNLLDLLRDNLLNDPDPKAGNLDASISPYLRAGAAARASGGDSRVAEVGIQGNLDLMRAELPLYSSVEFEKQLIRDFQNVSAVSVAGGVDYALHGPQGRLELFARGPFPTCKTGKKWGVPYAYCTVSMQRGTITLASFNTVSTRGNLISLSHTHEPLLTLGRHPGEISMLEIPL